MELKELEREGARRKLVRQSRQRLDAYVYGHWQLWDAKGQHESPNGGVGGEVRGGPKAGPVERGLHLRLGGRDPARRAVGRAGWDLSAGDDRRMPEGTKELVAMKSGYSGSTERWADVLRDLSRRRMRAPALAIADGAFGFWAAARDLWPEGAGAAGLVHRGANVLDNLPKRVQWSAKEALHEIREAPTRKGAQAEIDQFEAENGAKYLKPAESLRRYGDALLAFFDLSAEHWKSIRRLTRSESTFVTVRGEWTIC